MSTVSFSKRTLVISSSTPEDSFVDCIVAGSKIVVNSHSEVLDCDDQSHGSYTAVDSTAVNIVAHSIVANTAVDTAVDSSVVNTAADTAVANTAVDSTVAGSKIVADTALGKTVAVYLRVTIVLLQ